jgi:hypothetical protein
MSKALVLGTAVLVFSAAGSSAADFATPAYGYAAPAYAAAAPVYTAPTAPVVSGYYTAPVVSRPIYDYAAGSGYEYTAPGYWNRGYWGRDYGFEWR